MTVPKITISQDSETCIIYVDIRLKEEFKKFIQRGLNTYVDCHPAIKEFGDILIDGHIKQDYYSQRTDIKTNPPKSVKEIPLPICGHCFNPGHHHRFDCPALIKGAGTNKG